MKNQTLIYPAPFSQLRKIYNFCKQERVNFKELFKQLYESDDTYDNFLKLKASVIEGYISVIDYLNNNYLQSYSYYYNSDYYVNTIEGDIEHIDNVYFCEYYREFTSEKTSIVYIGSRVRSKNYCEKAIIALDLYLASDGYYYDYSALINSNNQNQFTDL